MKINAKYWEYIKEYEISIASAMVILLVIILTLSLLVPNINRANQIYSQGQEFNKKLDILTHKYNILTSLDYQLYKDNFLKLNQVLPESKDYVSLITTFDTLENQSGAKILQSDFQLGVFSANPAKSGQTAGSLAVPVPLNLEVSGNLASIKKIQDTIANFDGRFMVFDDMAASTKPNGVLDVTFTGRAFYYPLPATLGAIDTPLPLVEKPQEVILKAISALSSPPSPESTGMDKSSLGKINLFE